MSRKEEWLEDLKLEDLPESCQRIAEVIGVESTVQLMRDCGGTYLYIPKSDSLLRTVRDRAIRKKYQQGETVRNLAIKHKLTESRVREILYNQENPDQVTIFEV